ncbi:hypothetical protein [Gordonia sihwensis]|uniref:hypothetical protein n=1 Tax=Gordonia sihwensis TaxID=173559 RepID=UPI003D972B52
MNYYDADAVRAMLIEANSRNLYRRDVFDGLAGITSDDADVLGRVIYRAELACLEFPEMAGGFDPVRYRDHDFISQQLLADRIAFAFTGNDKFGDPVKRELDDALVIRKVAADGVIDVSLISVGWLPSYCPLTIRQLLERNYGNGRQGVGW